VSHASHEIQALYDPRQVWVDGCAECHLRSLSLPMSMMELDHQAFRDAWLRAFWWQHDDDTSLHISEAERPLLKQLWAMQVALERFFGWPVGSYPDNRGAWPRLMRASGALQKHGYVAGTADLVFPEGADGPAAGQ
jgi:hypothetical protein